MRVLKIVPPALKKTRRTDKIAVQIVAVLVMKKIEKQTGNRRDLDRPLSHTFSFALRSLSEPRSCFHSASTAKKGTCGRRDGEFRRMASHDWSKPLVSWPFASNGLPNSGSGLVITQPASPLDLSCACDTVFGVSCNRKPAAENWQTPGPRQAQNREGNQRKRGAAALNPKP